MKNPNQYTISDTQESVPASISPFGSATLTMVNGKRFAIASSSQNGRAKVGDYIYIKAQNKFIQIERVEGTRIGLVKAWDGTTVSAGAFRITPQPKAVEVSLYYRTGDSVIDGITRVEGQGDTWSKSSSPQEYLIGPFDVDATGGKVVDVSEVYAQ